MDANVNKGSESGHVRDDSRQFHTWLEVINLVDILGETEFLGALARVTAGLGQFLQNIIDRWKAELTLHVGRRIDLLDQLLISDQFLGADSEVRSHPVNDVIALWVHGGVVERILGVLDAEETGALLESLRAEFRDLTELGSGGEALDRRAVLHNVRCQSRTDARDITQEVRTGGVEIHSDAVHADDHGVVQFLPKQILIHIVLVLTHTQ